MKNHFQNNLQTYMFVYIMILMVLIGNGITYYTESRPLKLQTNLVLLFLIVINFINAQTKSKNKTHKP